MDAGKGLIIPATTAKPVRRGMLIVFSAAFAAPCSDRVANKTDRSIATTPALRAPEGPSSVAQVDERDQFRPVRLRASRCQKVERVPWP